MEPKDLDAIVDFLNKNPSADASALMKAFPSVKDSKTADAVFGYAHGIEQGNSPKKLQGIFPELFAQPTAHQQALNQADATLKSAYSSPQGDKAIDYLNQQAHDQAFYNSRQQQLQGQDATSRQVLAPPMLHQTTQTMRDAYRQNNPEPTRETVAAIGHLNPDQQNDLNASVYLKDRAADGDRQKQLANADAIRSGKLMYNVQNGSLTKPLDPLESIAYGWNQRKQSLAGYDTLTGSPDADVKSYLNNQVAKKDPDEAQPKPYNWGTLTSGLGSEAVPAAKMIIGGAAASAVAGPEAAPLGAVAATSSEYYKRNYHDSMVRVYGEAKQKGMSDDQALAYARPIAEKDAELGVVQNAAMTAAGARLGLGEDYEAFNQPGVKKVLGTTINNIGKFGKNALKEGTVMGGLSAGIQGQENINEGKNTTDNMLEAGEMGGVMPIALGLMIHAPKEIISGHGLNVVKQALTKVPTEAINSELGSMVNDASITPDKAMDITQAIAEHKAKDAAIPPSVKDDEARIQIQDKLDKRAALQKQLDTSAEPYHEGIKEKIANIDADIQAIPAKVREQQKLQENEQTTTGQRGEIPSAQKQTQPSEGGIESGGVSGSNRPQEVRGEENEPVSTSQKIKDHAIPIEGPTKVPVHEAPGNGSSLGGGNEGEGSVNKEVAAAQNQEAVKQLESDRNDKLDAAQKPDIKMEFVKAEDLVNSKDPIKFRSEHNGIKDGFKQLKQIIDCIWP